jgi:hypothetical protein
MLQPGIRRAVLARAREEHSIMSDSMRALTVGGALALALVVSSGTASAIPYVEIGDAGALIGSHQNVGGGVDSIVGGMTGATDVDLYRLVLAAGTFTASTGNAAIGNGPDTQLFLFNASGMGIAGNDDAPSNGTQRSFISANLAAGVYYLAVSVFNQDPYSSGGYIFPDYFNCCGHPVDGPTGPGGGSALSFWADGPAGAGTGQTGAYTVELNQATVPEPGTLLLLGGGISAMALRRRRKA